MSGIKAPATADDRLTHLDSSSNFSELTWFDRFYFNVQSPDGSLVLIVGGACYPDVQVEDGYICVGTRDEQLNLRFAQAWGGGEASTAIGPLVYHVVEPLKHWKLRVLDETVPVRMDLDARARTSACQVDSVTVPRGDLPPSTHEHFFQAMTYSGWIEVDGQRTSVDGWLGHRDRSWGARRTRERLGFHLWGAIHLPDGSIGITYNEARDHSVVTCDGAYMGADGSLTRVVDLHHDVAFNEDRTEIGDGTLAVLLEDGRAIVMRPRTGGAAFELAGAGYDGRHGTAVAGRELEIERWDLTDPEWSSGLTMRVVGRIYEVEVDGETFPGLLEVSVTRSPSYAYSARTEGKGGRE